MTKNGICSKIRVNQNIKIVDYKGGVIMKNVKKILIFLVTIFTVFCITQPIVHAADNPVLPAKPDTTYGIDANFYNPNLADDPNIDVGVIGKYVVPIYSILQYAVIAAALISLAVVGLKIMLGGTQQKAEYKQHLIPIVVGLCIAALLFTVIRVLLQIAGIF